MKITILGAAGKIGQSVSLLLKMQLPKNCILYLYDILPEIYGIVRDLNDIPTKVKVIGCNKTEEIIFAIKEATIILIVAGKSRTPGMNRSDLLSINGNIIYDLVNIIADNNSNAFIGIVTNPLNITTVIASEVLKSKYIYNPKKLFGITSLDIFRTRAILLNLKNKLLTADIINNIPVIGGHSECTILPLFSQISNLKFSKEKIQYLTKKIQNSGTKIVKEKKGTGSASLSMAYAILKFIFSLMHAIQGKKIIEYAYIQGNNNFSRFFSQPFILSKNGIKKILPIPKMSNFEKKELKNIIKILNNEVLIGEKFISIKN